MSMNDISFKAINGSILIEVTSINCYVWRLIETVTIGIEYIIFLTLLIADIIFI